MTFVRIALAAMVLAATGFFGSSAFATPDCGMNTGRAADGAPIPIGAIVTASGAADISTGAKGAKAYFDCVNANGGIHGRPIDYSFDDDQTRPDKAAEIAKKMVEDKRGVALIGSSSLVDCIATSQYYQQAGIISLMAGGVAPQCFNARNIATTNAGPRYGLLGAVKYAVERLHVKHMACPQPTVPGADWVCAGVEGYVKSKGVAYSHFTFDQQSADYDSLIQRIVQTGADSTIFLGSPPTIVPFLAAAEHADVGDKLKILAPSPVYFPDLPKAVGPYWNDKFWVDLEWGPTNSGGRDMNNFLAVMKAYNATPDSLAEGGYLAARIAVQALMSIPADKIDRATVTAALQNVQDFKSDIFCTPWSFGPKDATSRLGNRSGWIAIIHAGNWQVLPGCITLDDSMVMK
jgi:branched-chain amino acid transport system substrate-binding protein